MTEISAKHLADVRGRAIKMNRRAASKYGPAATDPGGDPTRDVFDYCINELAGLARYADMMQVRLDAAICDDTMIHARVRRVIGRVHDEGTHLAVQLAIVRGELLERGVHLGAAEDLDS